MTSNRNRRAFPRLLAGTVLAGSLAFAAQVEAQQTGEQGQRPARGAEQGGRGGRGGDRDPAQMIERRVTMLTERLDLTAAQVVSVREILTDEHTRMAALRPQFDRGVRGQRPDSAARAQRTRPDSAARAQMRAQMEKTRAQVDALRQRTDARIASVLNSDQRTTWQEMVAARGNRPEGRPGRGGRGGPGKGGSGRGGQQTPPPVQGR